MDYKLLLVDDDKNLLLSFKRLLAKRLEVDIAENGQAGLKKLKEGGPYAVVISDYKMPGMNGVQFLSEVAKVEPDTVRILLTAYADLEVAIDAVNKGHIFRLLTKPCPRPVLADVIKAGLRQYQLIKSEKELLEKTVAGSMKLLGELMNMLHSGAYERINRIQPLLRIVAKDLGDDSLWATESAAVLSQLGYVLLPEEVRTKIEKGKELRHKEQELFDQYPEISRKLTSNIPRLEDVSWIAYYVEKHFDGSGFPEDGVKGEAIPLGSRILKALMDYDRNLSLQSGSGPLKNDDKVKIVEKMRGDRRYDPKALDSLINILEEEKPYRVRTLPLNEIKVNMILAEDMYIEKKGKKTKILARGHEINAMVLEYMQNYASYLNLKNEIKVIEITPRGQAGQARS